MSDKRSRSGWRETTVRLAWSYGAAALAALGLCLWGVWHRDPTLTAMGVLGLVLVLAVAPVTFASVRGGGGGGAATSGRPRRSSGPRLNGWRSCRRSPTTRGVC